MNFKLAKARHLRLGQLGEKTARRLLVSKNMRILCCNYRTREGEIDIVARDGKTLVFVEVKTLRRTYRGRPAENLKSAQKRRIYRAAMRYLREIDLPDVVYRFDLIEVIRSAWTIGEVRHWQGHFSEDEAYFCSFSIYF